MSCKLQIAFEMYFQLKNAFEMSSRFKKDFQKSSQLIMEFSVVSPMPVRCDALEIEKKMSGHSSEGR